MTTLVPLQAPSPWPFGGPSVPGNLVPSGTTYHPDSNGRVQIHLRDLAALLSLGFTYGTPSILATALSGDEAVTVTQGGQLRSTTAQKIADLGGGGGLLTETIPLSASDINHLFSAPKTLIDEPGVGKVIIPSSITVALHVGTIPFDGSGNDPVTTFRYADGTIVSGAFSTLEAAQSQISVVPLSAAFLGSGLAAANCANQALVLTQASHDFVNSGIIAASNVSAGGAGYAVGDTGPVSGSTANDPPNYLVISVGGGGAVTGYTITDDRGGNEVATGVTTSTGGSQPGIGTGFEIDITSITPGNGSGSITVNYQIINLP